MSLRRLALFLPRDTPFYRGLHQQMRRGFEAEGVQTTGLCRLLGAAELRAFCQAQRPQVLFEMNRPRCEIPSLDPEVRHVTWVVDFNGRSLEHFEGSDITYLFGLTWVERYPHRGFHRWLGPGACPEDYALADPAPPPEVDAAFAGHIPRPWSPEELARDLTGGRGALRFSDLLPELEAQLRATRGKLGSADDFLHLAESIAGALTQAPLVLDQTLRYDISGRAIRMLNRGDLIDAAAAHTAALALYGPDNWRLWPAYAPFYRGPLDTPAELRRAYQTARVTLHEGNGVHFRSMDCLCAGGVLLFRQTPHDARPGGIASLFEPHVHYVPFTLETLGDELARLLGDPPRRARLGRAAAAAVRGGHTWRHRAREILRDLEAL
jgi:hypothetical protein